ncbi:CoA transferase [Xylophilus sp. Kf1]|nr:CoA transferase [Xylophilus sp. Kf1]
MNTRTDTDRLALAGVRVLEVGSGPALAYAGKLLADFGAEVIKAEPPAGDPWRRMPPLVDTGASGSAPESAVWAWLNTNKHGITADPERPQDRHWLAELAGGCDLVLDARALSEGIEVTRSPVWATPGDPAGAGHRPIEVVLTWFGETGPYSGFAGSESVCRALSGAVHGSGPVQGPPHMPHDVQTGIVAGLAAFSSAVAALIGRADGSRRYVLSIHEVVFGVVEMEAGMLQDGRHPRARLGVNRFCNAHPAGIYPTAAGWLGVFAHTLPQWTALCQAIGRPDFAADPRFSSGPDRIAHADAIDDGLGPALLRKTAREWFEILGEARCPAVLVPTMAELLEQPVHRQRGAFVPVRLGQACFEGPVVPLPLGAAGPLPGGRAPLPGADDDRYRQTPPALPAQRRLSPAPAGCLPLRGLRVIDLSMGWAGPLASRTLADFGAEVIKIESVRYPDWWRGNHFTEAFYRDRLYEKNSNFALMNRNKLDLTLDLTTARGRDLLLRLVEDADAVIENYSAEVLPRLGLTYDALRAVNDRLVMLSMPAFGLGNAWSNTRAYGGTLEQASGLPLYTGHPDGPPALTSYAYGDPMGGFNAGAALLVALLDRQKTGEGRHVNLSQVEAMLPLTAPYLLEQSIRGEVSPRQANAHSPITPHGCYRCAGDDAWIVIGTAGDTAGAALAEVVGYRPAAGDLDAAIGAWTARHTADEAMRILQARRVPAGVVRPMEQVLADPHLLARGFWQRMPRDHLGEYLASTAWFREGTAPTPLRQVAPTLGQHSHSILRRLLGLTDVEIQQLEKDEITGTSAKPKAGRTTD